MENKKVKNDLAQSELIKEYYIKHPNKNVKHPEIVDWAVKEWNKRTGGVFRDLPGKKLCIPKSSQHDHFKTVRITINDLEGIDTDRPS